MHCSNYLCRLSSGCVCNCGSCVQAFADAAVCKNCGCCPTCGKPNYYWWGVPVIVQPYINPPYYPYIGDPIPNWNPYPNWGTTPSWTVGGTTTIANGSIQAIGDTVQVSIDNEGNFSIGGYAVNIN